MNKKSTLRSVANNYLTHPNERKGITLIALVITIIVLLILAGVTIVTLTGDNGLLQKAGDAKNASTDAEIGEQIKLAYSEWQIAQHTEIDKTETEFITEKLILMFGNKLEDNSVKIENGKVSATVNDIPYEYNILTGKSGRKDLAIGGQITKDNYGDYIDLGKSVVGDANSTKDDWRIFYNDTTNNVVYAILSSCLPNNIGASSSAGLSQIGEYYTRANSPSDMMRAFNSTMWKEKLLSSNLQENTKIEVKGAISRAKLLDAYNDLHGTNYKDVSSRGNVPVYLYLDPNDPTKGIDELFISNKCYWLAASYGLDYFWNIRTDGDFWQNNRCWQADFIGVRPVAILDSSIKVKSEIMNGDLVWSLMN